MPLYSARQLIDKTMLLNHHVNFYSVSELNAKGNQVKPSGVLQKGATFVVDSFLQPTLGYTNSYGIKYAPRDIPYLTFYSGGNYLAVAIAGDGRFSIDALKDQGALTVKEEMEKERLEQLNPFEKFFDGLLPGGLAGLGKSVKTILILAVVVILLIKILPLIKTNKQ
ncbi:MAG TPA: hypothetical protein VF487_13185 [Chitinophagaceae bacterium]